MFFSPPKIIQLSLAINEHIQRVCEDKNTHTHCISIGKIPKCQLLFLAPSLTLPQPTRALFYRLGKFWSICFCCEKKTFSLYFIPLFVGKHLKEIEGLNDKGVCIQSGAVLKDCMEERPICWGQLALGGALARECHRPGPG